MDTLFKHITNSICHAFNALHQDVPGLVHKSKLKVLTANIATLFDLYGIEKGLDHYRSTVTLNFEHFRYYLLQELFTTLSASSITVPELRNYESKIEEICWLVCRKQYLSLNNNLPNTNIFNEHYLYKLFRIFCMLGELNEIDNEQYCVKLHQSEMDLLLQQLVSSMGLDYDNDNNHHHNHNLILARSSQKQSYCFVAFLDKLNFNNYNKTTTIELTKESILEAIDEMYQTYINDIIKKGYLLRRGYLLPTLKEYWFVLQPYQLLYYKNKNQKDLCGTIILDSNCMVRSSTIPTNNSQWNTKKSGSSATSMSLSSSSTSSTSSSSSNILPSTISKNSTSNTIILSNSSPSVQSQLPSTIQHQSSSQKQVKILKFSLSTNDRTFEMATKDHRSRLQWIAALQLAITYSMGKEGYQRDQLVKRQKRREYELNCKRADDIQRTNQLKEVELTKTQLEQEKLARMAAERAAQQLKIVAIEDSRRVAELEDVKHNLESLLREETQAKHDEEIVRALQARVLAEEWEKREELESLQEEQRLLLAAERQKRLEFEQKQKDKEKHLTDAKHKLTELECERQRLDMELKQARIKIMQSEENKEILEARLRTINGRTLIRGDDNTTKINTTPTTNGGGGDFRIRRSLSFMCTNRERTNQ